MKKHLLSLREFVWITVVGCVVTPAALWMLAKFVHSNEVMSMLSLALIAPYVGLARWGTALPDWAFWAVFVLAQALYLIVGYVALKSAVRRLHHH